MKLLRKYRFTIVITLLMTATVTLVLTGVNRPDAFMVVTLAVTVALCSYLWDDMRERCRRAERREDDR